MLKRTRTVQRTRQQKHILLLALFLLKHDQKMSSPERRYVTKFIGFRNLITIREEDRKIVSTGEEAWENSIAFRREDLKEEGCLEMPRHGVWKITPLGEKRIIEWCALIHYFVAVRPKWQEQMDAFEIVFEEKVVITKDTVNSALYAFELAKKIFPNAIPEVPADIQGKITL